MAPFLRGRKGMSRVPGPRSTAKQHPKDHRERYDTHSYSQDYKDAYYRIDNVGLSESQEPEPHQVLVPLKRMILIGKLSMSAIGTKQTCSMR